MSETNNSRGTILVVDDIPTNLKILFTYLRNLNFKVRVAQDGAEALEQVTHSQPDLILLDVMMPKMNGFETCRRLKADKKTCNVPVIFMTALTDTVDKVKGFEIGAIDYITKPIQYEEVLSRVVAHVNLRKLQKSIEEKNVELAEQNKELEAFVHTVAHDIKNPLNVIIGFSSLLKDDLASVIEEEAFEFIKHIEHSGYEMLNTINSLLLLSDARIQHVNVAPINMEQVISEARQRLASMVTEYKGKITMPTTWPSALGYAPWIEQVWVNYISNALKYGGNPPILELGATPQDDDEIQFWVRDNGEGLSKEQCAELFVPFTNITETRHKGGGLGLAIVRRIIEKCGGKFGCESTIGEGSTFYFTLPTANT